LVVFIQECKQILGRWLTPLFGSLLMNLCSIPLIGYVLVNPTPLDVKILEYIAKGWNIPFLSVGFFYVWVWLTHKFSLVGQTNSPAGYNNGNPRPAHVRLSFDAFHDAFGLPLAD
jgi:hypothetical protein